MIQKHIAYTNKSWIIVWSILFIALPACEDTYNIKTPSFDVRTEKNTYSVGEEITFELDGNPDIINFFSGNIGNNYMYHDVEHTYDMLPTLSFRSAKFAGNNEDCAELFYTTDFNENYNYENVKTVNWINISERFAIPPIVGTTATFSESGIVNISDIVEKDKPIYFAWHCKTNEASSRTRFQVQSFTINGEDVETPELSGVLYSQAQLDFRWCLNEASAADPTNLPSITNTTVFWTGVFDNTSGPYKEGYAVSGPITIPTQINLGFDKPQTIKSMLNENMKSFSYTFEKAGEYEVVFVALNANFNGTKENVQRVKLTIKE